MTESRLPDLAILEARRDLCDQQVFVSEERITFRNFPKRASLAGPSLCRVGIEISHWHEGDIIVAGGLDISSRIHVGYVT
ncbi:hypothetical protein [Blastococcus brunescens]|uniref:Uncharacterized protein n=1 Tax=Blastococcus brunescens TaxID=1564165 RepID=A0ABZ1B5D0_9ACTN|nr:hypothetical protein [Blastococcus sp. BMG 8361]WRL65043.1 hypothetical protein U6N30_04890 [Blastococcus sp. BMG 8361]